MEHHQGQCPATIWTRVDRVGDDNVWLATKYRHSSLFCKPNAQQSSLTTETVQEPNHQYSYYSNQFFTCPTFISPRHNTKALNYHLTMSPPGLRRPSSQQNKNSKPRLLRRRSVPKNAKVDTGSSPRLPRQRLPQAQLQPAVDPTTAAQAPIHEEFPTSGFVRAHYEPNLIQRNAHNNSGAVVQPLPWRLLDVRGNLVQDGRSTSIEEGQDDHDDEARIRLCNANNPQQAYAWLPQYHPIRLDHRKGWGYVYYAVIYPRSQSDSDDECNPATTTPTFRQPAAADAGYAAVKVLNKAVVNAHLAQGNQENPYREIVRYAELGDNVHVIRPLEILQDDTHLFIVTPLGTPLDRIVYSQPDGLPPEQAHAYFTKIVHILQYLDEHDIHQRDVKPENFVILPRTKELVLIDMAMSLRMPPRHHGNGIRPDMLPTGTFGTPAFMAPEIALQAPRYDGVQADLWSAVGMLYLMSTGRFLYGRPSKMDGQYLYFCVAQQRDRSRADNHFGNMVAAREMCRRVGLNEADTAKLLLMVRSNREELPRPLLALLAHSLCHDPAQRWTLSQVLASDYCRNDDAGV